jgi:predicted nucleic acid-binding protein
VILLDTTVLAYAVGTDHPLAGPCRALVDAIGDGTLAATTTIEVIQEFVHVHSRRGRRVDAIRHGRSYARLLKPLIVPDVDDLDTGLDLYGDHPSLSAFDAVLAAIALRPEPSILVSADHAFATVRDLRWVDPNDSAALATLLPSPVAFETAMDGETKS